MNGRRFLNFALACLLALGSIAAGAHLTAKAAEADGSELNPYLISTAAELRDYAAKINSDVEGTTWRDKHYKVTSDISLFQVGGDWTPIGTYDYNFTGVFDGGGRTISFMTVNNPNSNYQGMFGYVSGGTVKNVHLTSAFVTGKNHVGGLVGNCTGHIENCTYSGTVTGNDYVGGLAGKISFNAYISNSSVSGTVTGNNNVGGLAGENSLNGNISNSSNTGNVLGNDYVGGVSGNSENRSTISNSTNTGNVTGNNCVGGVAGNSDGLIHRATIADCSNSGAVKGKDYVGGVAGKNVSNAKITNSHNTGDVEGMVYLGGVAGNNRDNAIIKDSSNTGAVSSTSEAQYIFIGGVAGNNTLSTVDNCFNTGNVTAIGTYVGGVVGDNGVQRGDPAGAITNSWNAGTVTGGNHVGGVAGNNDFTAIIKNCYNTGDVMATGDYAGGVAGLSSLNSRIENCYNIGNVTGSGNYIGGIAGATNTTVNNIVNSYFLQGTAGKGVGVGLDQSEVKTWGAFYGGEVAWLLGDGFGQRRNVDDYPVLRTADPSNVLYRIDYRNGTDLHAEQFYNAGNTVSAPTPNPESGEAGVPFLNWEGLPATMPAHDCTAYARFDFPTYILEWHTVPVIPELDFGYSSTIDPWWFEVKNTGNSLVEGIAVSFKKGPESPFLFVISMPTSLAPEHQMSVAVRPKANLNAGTYTDTMVINWTGGDGATGIEHLITLTVRQVMPGVTTGDVTSTPFGATVSGMVTSGGGLMATERGFVCGPSSGPEIGGPGVTQVKADAGTGLFSAVLFGFSPNTTYHVRAYATNAAGTSYGGNKEFKTLAAPPVITGDITDITVSGATLHGEVEEEAGEVTARGFVYGSLLNPAIGASGVAQAEAGEGLGPFSAVLTGLPQSTTYYVCAYAISGTGTIYGDNKVFTTLGPPSVTTGPVTDITATSALVSGEWLSGPVSFKGFVYAPGVDPLDLSNPPSAGASANFTQTLNYLFPGTTYYVRAYAFNGEGIGYGNLVEFTTLAGAPGVSTGAAADVTTTGATLNGEVTFDGGATISERGFVYATTENPDLDDNKVMVAGTTGQFSAALTNLSPRTNYHVRAYAINSQGISYGTAITFTTSNMPVVTTGAVTDTSSSGATLSGWVTCDGGAEVEGRGFVYATTGSPEIGGQDVIELEAGDGTGPFWGILSTLSPGTTYYVRAYATNDAGTSYGISVQFTTEAEAPSVAGGAVTGVTTSGATLNGEVTSDGGATILERGFVYATAENPTLNDNKVTVAGSTGPFSAVLAGLSPGTTYYVRAYATNSVDTGYGDNVPFTTLTPDYSISAAPTALGFGSIFEGETAPDAQTITLTNVGNQNLTLQAPSSSGNAYALGDLSATSLAPQETASFTVQPKGNLGPGSYNETVTVNTVQGSSDVVTVTFTVWSVYQKRTLIDFDAGVSVTGESVHKDAKLIVEELTLHPPGQCAACDAIRQAQADSASLLVLGLNISLDRAPGFIGELLVTLAVDPQYNGKTVTILHCRKGVLETYSAVVSEGEVTFTVTALSPMALFAAVEKATAPEPQKTLPITGFGGPALLLLPGTAVALTGAALLYRRRRLSRK